MENHHLPCDWQFHSAAWSHPSLPERSGRLSEFRHSRIAGGRQRRANLSGGAASHLRVVADRLWNSCFAVSVSHLGARSLRVSSGTGSNVTRGRVEKIWIIWPFATGHSPAAARRSTLDESARDPVAREHHL